MLSHEHIEVTGTIDTSFSNQRLTLSPFTLHAVNPLPLEIALTTSRMLASRGRLPGLGGSIEDSTSLH